MTRARYIMIGGFLGAGKSTLVGRLARHLVDGGMRVGLITNDQASGLVDTANLRSQGFTVEEIAGGCFCCRFDSLREAAEKLTHENRPDVFVAEPVGSCTDLVATVSYPLRRMYGESYAIAPLAVLVDPDRALRVLGLEEGRRFSQKVLYVYEKQLEEADAIAINKCDTLDEDRRAALRAALSARFPRAELFEISARDGTGLAPLFDTLLHEEQRVGRALTIDYETYAEGEALLGWLNATLELESPRPVDANELLEALARALQRRLDAAGAEVAHLKMTLSPRVSAGEVAAELANEIALVSLVRQDFVPELSQRLASPVEGGQIIVNLRAEAAPEDLRSILEAELAERSRDGAARLTLEHAECFRPGKPQPTHRLQLR